VSLVKKILVLFTVILMLILSIFWAIAQEDDFRTGQAETLGLAAGTIEFTYQFPAESWRPTLLESMVDRGAALILEAPVGLPYPVAVTTLFMIEAERAVDVFDQVDTFPYEISELEEAIPFVLDERHAAEASGQTSSDNDTMMLSLQVEDGIYLVVQTVSLEADLSELRESIEVIAASVVATLPEIIPTATNTQPPAPTAPPQLCPYRATISLDLLRVLSAEEARGARDFAGDGDQVILTLALGPIVGNQEINAGTLNEFLFDWTANLYAGEIRENFQGMFAQTILALKST